jgi:hypothetical protein
MASSFIGLFEALPLIPAVEAEAVLGEAQLLNAPTARAAGDYADPIKKVLYYYPSRADGAYVVAVVQLVQAALQIHPTTLTLLKNIKDKYKSRLAATLGRLDKYEQLLNIYSPAWTIGGNASALVEAGLIMRMIELLFRYKASPWRIGTGNDGVDVAAETYIQRFKLKHLELPILEDVVRAATAPWTSESFIDKVDLAKAAFLCLPPKEQAVWQGGLIDGESGILGELPAILNVGGNGLAGRGTRIGGEVAGPLRGGYNLRRTAITAPPRAGMYPPAYPRSGMSKRGKKRGGRRY